MLVVVVVVVADALISSIVVNDGDAIGVAAVFFCNVVKLDFSTYGGGAGDK